MINITPQLTSIFGPRLKENEPMSRHTNFRLGGPARWFVVAEREEEVMESIKVCEQHLVPWTVIGGGSNLVVSDTGYNGLILQLGMRQLVIEPEPREDGLRCVTAGAGVLSVMMARAVSEAGLAGFAWAISLPGTIGGAVRGNAGCFGGETKDYLESARVLRNGEILEVRNAELGFGYRESVIKHSKDVVLSATFAFPSGDPSDLKASMSNILAQRKTTQPLYGGSAGCMFKNYEATPEEMQRIGAQFDIPSAARILSRIPAGWAVEMSGAKGMRVGDAEVSEIHGNFLVNRGHATEQDVRELSRQVTDRVRQVLGIELHEEVQRLGE